MTEVSPMATGGPIYDCIWYGGAYMPGSSPGMWVNDQRLDFGRAKQGIYRWIKLLNYLLRAS